MTLPPDPYTIEALRYKPYTDYLIDRLYLYMPTAQQMYRR